MARGGNPVGLSTQLRMLDMGGPSLDCRMDLFKNKRRVKKSGTTQAWVSAETVASSSELHLEPSASLARVPQRYKTYGALNSEVIPQQFPYQEHQWWAAKKTKKTLPHSQSQSVERLFACKMKKVRSRRGCVESGKGGGLERSRPALQAASRTSSSSDYHGLLSGGDAAAMQAHRSDRREEGEGVRRATRCPAQ
jgi:hypothetical protein